MFPPFGISFAVSSFEMLRRHREANRKAREERMYAEFQGELAKRYASGPIYRGEIKPIADKMLPAPVKLLPAPSSRTDENS